MLVIENTNLIHDLILVTTSLEALSVFVASIIGYIGVMIMAYGGIKSAIHFMLSSIRRQNHLPHIRIELGKHLALGLEFLVGKDIIESIMQPTWDELGKLAAIITLRTAVTMMLSWELKEIKKEINEEKEYKAAMRKIAKK
ncbi:DUF1622 domain-containing protein [Candidatus Peregrinibacteria bacterium]|jgi:uncharacterized membrane protein|nr:DUF1622 domain-containing protein [Candidatus Peregrinibacteria bacterium]MBT5468790.1 DUF1622 domain-containing protein [Candidatus Peregrinibacteria bacterium]MBT7337808.1 DUF1622 domain-containing protein [Candidatus Peregrinibacteria bacterium]